MLIDSYFEFYLIAIFHEFKFGFWRSVTFLFVILYYCGFSQCSLSFSSAHTFEGVNIFLIR